MSVRKESEENEKGKGWQIKKKEDQEATGDQPIGFHGPAPYSGN